MRRMDNGGNVMEETGNTKEEVEELMPQEGNASTVMKILEVACASFYCFASFHDLLRNVLCCETLCGKCISFQLLRHSP